MKKFLFYFALSGWVIAILAHILSLAKIDVTQKIPFIWLLHIGIFIVWLPVILDLKKNQEVQTYLQSGTLNRANPLGLFKIIFKETPIWISIIAAAGFFYAFLNFILAFSSQSGTPDIQDGQFVLENHGKLIKSITEQEYHHYKALQIRGISGHWMLFYGIATAALYKFSGLPKRG